MKMKQDENYGVEEVGGTKGKGEEMKGNGQRFRSAGRVVGYRDLGKEG